MSASALLDAARPGLAELLREARAKLSPEDNAEIDARLTRAEEIAGAPFANIVIYYLKGDNTPRINSLDLCEIMKVSPQALSDRISNAQTPDENGLCEVTDEDVRRKIRDCDVQSSIASPTCDSTTASLTTSPRGVTMLSLRAARLLLMGCKGSRGRGFRVAIESLFEHAAQLEQLVDVLCRASRRAQSAAPDERLDRIEQVICRLPETVAALVQGMAPRPLPPEDLARREAHETIRAMLAAGRRNIPRWLQDQAYGPQGSQLQPAGSVVVSGGVIVPRRAEFPEDFTFHSMRALAEALECHWTVARRRLKTTGLWLDAEWHIRPPYDNVSNGRMSERLAHGFRRGIISELRRREASGVLPFSGRAR